MKERGAEDWFAHPQRWPSYLFFRLDRRLARHIADDEARRRVAQVMAYMAVCAAGLGAEELGGGWLPGLLGVLAGLLLSLFYPLAALNLHRLADISRQKAAAARARGEEAAQGQGREWVLRARYNALLFMALLLPLYAWLMRELFRRGAFDELF